VKIDKATSAVIIALITGLSGLGSSIINRYSVNHGAVVESRQVSKKSYRAMAETIEKLTEDIDDNAKRMDNMENTLSLQTLTMKFLMADVGIHQPEVAAKAPKLPDEPKSFREKRTPTRLRGKPPTFDAAQRAPLPANAVVED